MVLLLSLAAAAAAYAQDGAAVPTQTNLSVDARGLAGASQTRATVTVTGADGQAAGGIVNLYDGNRQLAQVLLNPDGEAAAALTLPVGTHNLGAVYLGDAAHQASASDRTEVHTLASGVSPGFAVSLSAVAPSPMSLAAGDSGSATVTVTPINNAALTSPMFVTLSCSGLPTLASCSFTPENVEILENTPATCAAGSPASACPPTSLMVISTEGPGNSGTHAPANRHASAIGMSLLLPGVLGLGGAAWGVRRRRWLQRMALMALLGVVATLGMTACNPYYYYYNHGPEPTPATPAGTYTVTVTAQSNNGVASISNSTTIVLTVQ